MDPSILPLQVQSVTPLAADIYRILLQSPAGTLPQYYAGQYLQLLVPGQETAFFSIANAPGERTLELHIQVHPDQQSADAILQYLQNEPVVNARLPLGQCYFSGEPDAEVVLVAAGTGFAQIKAVADYLLHHEFSRPITLYWGVRHPHEMYERDKVESWAAQYAQLTFVPVSADNLDNEWEGHHAELVKAVADDHHQWSEASVMVSGSPAMVYTFLDTLGELGLKETNFYSDVLEYAPR